MSFGDPSITAAVHSALTCMPASSGKKSREGLQSWFWAQFWGKGGSHFRLFGVRVAFAVCGKERLEGQSFGVRACSGSAGRPFS